MRRAPLTLAIVLSARAALAQPAGDVAAAAAAFQEGQRAQLTQDFPRAAEMFELADAAAPSAPALRSAIRNRQAAQHLARAATLALRARARDASDPQSAQLAAEVLDALAPRLTRISLRCTPSCTLLLDGGALSSGSSEAHEVFVDPGSRTLEASWGPGRSRSSPVEATAGAQVTLILEAPPEPAPTPAPEPAPEPPPAVAAPTPTPVAPPPAVEAPPPAARPLSPWVFGVLLGATAVTGGTLLWSGVDTLSARDTYVAQPTEQRYLDGVGLQTRTNALLATTATLAAATALTAGFTEWRGARAARVTALAAPLPGGASLGVVGSF
ncbi:MAG: hypothetical protein R3A48_00275 [Polyangiales bacterium]